MIEFKVLLKNIGFVRDVNGRLESLVFHTSSNDQEQTFRFHLNGNLADERRALALAFQEASRSFGWWADAGIFIPDSEVHGKKE